MRKKLMWTLAAALVAANAFVAVQRLEAARSHRDCGCQVGGGAGFCTELVLQTCTSNGQCDSECI